MSIPEFLNHDTGSSSRDQYKLVSRWARKFLQRNWSLLKQLCGLSLTYNTLDDGAVLISRDILDGLIDGEGRDGRLSIDIGQKDP